MTLTNQEYFDGTVEHLLSMTSQAKGLYGLCKYRSLLRNGLACAVGHWIPDGHDALNFSGSVEDLSLRYPELTGIAWPDTPKGLSLAMALQEVHDFDDNWDLSGFVALHKLQCISSR